MITQYKKPIIKYLTTTEEAKTSNHKLPLTTSSTILTTSPLDLTSVCLNTRRPSPPSKSLPDIAVLSTVFHLTVISPSAPFFLTTGIIALPMLSFTRKPRFWNITKPGSANMGYYISHVNFVHDFTMICIYNLFVIEF